MRIVADVDDAEGFIALVERISLGLLERYEPAEFVLLKIDNWFGSKWLGFQGKVLGAMGVWHKPYGDSASTIRIPPFVPNRVVSQRRFAGPSAYSEIPSGSPIHVAVPSNVALTRKAALHAPQTALAWYSGNSAVSGRGALMAYIPSKEGYWAWYAGWEKEDEWKLHESWDIHADEIAQLVATTTKKLNAQ